MHKIFRFKWLVLIVAAGLLLFFGRSLEINSITDSAIVLGLGIEVDENDVYTMSAQANVPNAAESGGGSSKVFAVYSAKGKTFADCLSTMSQSMGLKVSLSHCNTIVMHTDVLKKDLKDIFQSLQVNWYLGVETLLLATDDKPKEILEAKTPMVASTPFYLQSILKKAESFGTLHRLSVKDYIVDLMAKSKTTVMDYLIRKEIENSELVKPTLVDKPSPQNKGGDSSSKLYEYDISKSMVLGMGFENFLIDENSSEIADFFINKKAGGEFNIDLPSGEKAEYKILKTKSKMKYENGKVHAELKMDLVLQELSEHNSDETYYFELENRELLIRESEYVVKERVMKTFKESQEHNADIFQIANLAYQKQGYKFNRTKDFLKNLKMDVKIKIVLQAG